jgi:hypothetical protein
MHTHVYKHMCVVGVAYTRIHICKHASYLHTYLCVIGFIFCHAFHRHVTIVVVRRRKMNQDFAVSPIQAPPL